MIFRDRADAGRRLAEKLKGYTGKDGLVLAIPRGGVVAGAEVARILGLELDLIIPRKLGAPHNPEVAIGAVAQDGTTIFDRRLLELLGVSQTEFDEIITCEVNEIKRRLEIYRGSSDQPEYAGRQLVVVDDGVATGYTMQAALRSARNFQPRELILAIPVAPREVMEKLEKEVDRAVCLVVPEDFYAVGQFYQRFEQTEDCEVVQILKEFNKK